MSEAKKLSIRTVVLRAMREVGKMGHIDLKSYTIAEALIKEGYIRDSEETRHFITDFLEKTNPEGSTREAASFLARMLKRFGHVVQPETASV